MHIIMCFLWNGTQTRISDQKHIAAVNNTHIVEEKSSEISKNPQMISAAITPTAAAIPNGAARLIAFFAKLPRIIPKFGSNVSRNDGVPIISALMSVSWMGLNG